MIPPVTPAMRGALFLYVSLYFEAEDMAYVLAGRIEVTMA